MKSYIEQFFVTEKLNTRCDEIINCMCDARFSDRGFTDGTKIMIRPRTGTETLGRLPAGTGNPRDILWFTDDDNIKAGYISKDGEVYKCSYRNIGRFLGYFQNKEDATAVGQGRDYDYYVVHQTLYIFSSGVGVEQAYTWTNNFDNEADLFATYPTPEDNLFCFLRDSNSVYYSSGGYWIPVAENYSFSAIGLGNDPSYPATFNTVTLPIDYQTADTARDASAVEAIKVSSGLEATAATYVGSYAIITSGVYKGKYGYIFDYDTSTKEFKIVSLGNATPIQSGTTYSIFEKKGRYIQITNGKNSDKYYNGTAIETKFTGYVLSHIEKFIGFPGGGPGIIRTFGNQCYTSIGDSVFISDVSQPLWFNINDSIDLQKYSPVDDFFVWKNKMIAHSQNYTTFIDPNVSSGSERTFDFKNYGIVPGSAAEVLDDFWFLTYSGQIIPLSLSVYGTIYEKQNIGGPIIQYLKTMRENVTACFDGLRYYIYGENGNTEGFTCVYDTYYKFWSVYTGIRPKKFLVDSGITYFIEAQTGTLKRFTDGKVTDSEVQLDQYITSKDLSGGRVFLKKSYQEMNLHVENKNQKFIVGCQYRNSGVSVFKDSPLVIQEKRSDDLSPVSGFESIDEYRDISLFRNIPLGNEQAHIFRWKILNNGTNGFYLNGLEVLFNLSETASLINNIE